MLTFFAMLIFCAGSAIVFSKKIQLGLGVETCAAFAAMCAGGFIVGQNMVALFYTAVAIMSGLIYHTFKVFYHVVPQEKSSATRRR